MFNSVKTCLVLLKLVWSCVVFSKGNFCGKLYEIRVQNACSPYYWTGCACVEGFCALGWRFAGRNWIFIILSDVMAVIWNARVSVGNFPCHVHTFFFVVSGSRLRLMRVEIMNYRCRVDVWNFFYEGWNFFIEVEIFYTLNFFIEVECFYIYKENSIIYTSCPFCTFDAFINSFIFYFIWNSWNEL